MRRNNGKGTCWANPFEKLGCGRMKAATLRMNVSGSFDIEKRNVLSEHLGFFYDLMGRVCKLFANWLIGANCWVYADSLIICHKASFSGWEMIFD